jgi:hypothetical protein
MKVWNLGSLLCVLSVDLEIYFLILPFQISTTATRTLATTEGLV